MKNLRFVGNSGFQTDIAKDDRVHRSLVYKTVMNCIIENQIA